MFLQKHVGLFAADLELEIFNLNRSTFQNAPEPPEKANVIGPNLGQVNDRSNCN